jgi:hypothetical protein
MAALIWDEIGARIFETGVSKGVFYDYEGYGVAWNGLTSVEENTSHQVEPIFFDGEKFNDVVTHGEFSGVMKAFTYPDEFLPYEGIQQEQEGILITGQQVSRFGLSFQTKVGNDVEGVELGYKIHLMYNLTANPSQKTFNTMSLDVEPVEFEWTITAIPEIIDNFRPTSHVVIDSRKVDPYLLSDLEGIIYGNAYDDAFLPPLKTFNNYIQEWMVLRSRQEG